MKITKAAAIAAVRRWCAANGKDLISRPRHMQTAATVVGYAAPKSLIVRLSAAAAESHMREWTEKYPLEAVGVFDPKLAPGDSCIYAYVRTAGCGEPIAIRIPRGAGVG